MFWGVCVTSLFSMLYDYTLNQSLAYLALSPEYSNSSQYAEEKEQMLLSKLAPEEAGLLRSLLDELELQHGEEQRALFQAALALHQELHQTLSRP